MAKKSFITIAIIALLFVSCAEKSIQIPLSATSGQTEIYDNSPVWFSKSGDTISINKGGLISSTNWFFAIEKTLPLRLIVPNIQKLRKKKKNSIHAKAGTKNYFVYADTLIKKNSFFDFGGIKYKHISKNTLKDSIKNKLFISNSTIQLNNEKLQYKDLKQALLNLNNEKSLQLSAASNTTFQNYIKVLLPLEKMNITLDSTQYIVNN